MTEFAELSGHHWQSGILGLHRLLTDLAHKGDDRGTTGFWSEQMISHVIPINCKI